MSLESSFKCAQIRTDSLEAAVVCGGVFLDIQHLNTHHDIKLTPDDARALAEWLSAAADEAEAFDE